MLSEVERIQESLIEALSVEPLLVRAEQYLHSAHLDEERGGIFSSLSTLLEPEPPVAEIDRELFQGPNGELVDWFRAAMQQAISAGANLAEAEQEVLESLGMRKVGELRTVMQSHLEGPAELPDRDLAIYVPMSDEEVDEFHLALRRDLQALEVELGEVEIGQAEHLPAAEASRTVGPEPARPVVEAAAAHAPADVGSELRIALGVEGSAPAGIAPAAPLSPIPMLTAALEAIGLGGDGFGFILRYGRYAGQGRKSEFLVGGLGLADLSRRLTGWLDVQGPLEGQVQVIDEGSGELTIYLLVPEAT